jgi:predicted ATPase/DNA-binding XRE family transcriptional regulator
MSAQQTFGYWLRLKRKALDLTREEFAARVGCSAATIRKLETEERRPSAQIVARLVGIFNIPIPEQPAFLRFARGDWQSAPAELKQEPPWRTPTITSTRSNLPSTVTSLIGREHEIALLRGYLQDPNIRLITQIGPPGIGKTRLSMAVAHDLLSDFPAGVFFVALAPVEDPTLISATIAQALGYLEAKHLPAWKQLVESIGDKQMLIVLDNCEHIIDGIAPLASDLLSACPRLKILTTSRESLRIPGEWLFAVPALEVPKDNMPINLENASKFPALILFAERARAVRSDFSLTNDNLQQVASICAQLDGLPLAIELIAARMRFMSPQALLERLTDTFLLSADGIRASSTRQKTIGNAIGWSYDFLAAEEQQIFASLAVFSGGFTLEAAETICPPTSKSTTELVASLLDKSLLQRASTIDGEQRFFMLVTIQQFALNRLKASNIEFETRERHLFYFLDLAEKANQNIHSANQLEWIRKLEKELANFRSALEWATSHQKNREAMRLLSALSWYWGLWHHNREMRNWFDKIRILPELDRSSELYARLLTQVGHSSWNVGDFQYARTILEESIALWGKSDSYGERGLAEALSILGMVVHSIDANYAVAQSLFEQSFALYKKCGDQWGMAFDLFNLGWVADHQNQDEAAQKFLAQSLDIFTYLGDLWSIGRASQFLGQLFLKQKNYARARQYYEQHLEIEEKLQVRAGIVIALGNLGDLYRHQNLLDEAEQYYLKSLAVCREYGLRIDRGYNLYALGMLGLQKNDYGFAEKYIRQYFESGQSVSRRLAASDLCLGMAAVAGGKRQAERAAQLYGAALVMLEEIDIPYTPFDRAEFERHVQIARDQLGMTGFEADVTVGRTMPIEKAIDLALHEVESGSSPQR